jgi:hypothetical protein
MDTTMPDQTDATTPKQDDTTQADLARMDDDGCPNNSDG